MGTAAASTGAAGPSESEGLRAGRSSGRTKPEYTAASGRHDHATTGAGRHVSPGVRRPGLGARLLATSDEARAGYNLQFRQRFFLSDNQRRAVSDWRNTNYLSFFLSNGIFFTNRRCGFKLY